MDYGHQHFLDNLANQKSIINRALERVVRRLADVLFQHHKWFSWVREVQDEDDSRREKEKERVKQEAVLFQRHQKAMESRKRLLREKENLKMQEEFLDRAYKDRVLEGEDIKEWDPIEDVIEDDRGDFVELLKYFLWQDGVHDFTSEGEAKATHLDNGGSLNGHEAPQEVAKNDKDSPAETLEASKSEANENHRINNGKSTAQINKKQSKRDKKKSRKSKAAQEAPSDETKASAPSKDQIDKSNMETRADMLKRLEEGLEYTDESVRRSWIRSATSTRTSKSPFEEDEIDDLVGEVAEVKNLLFCRTLLSQASLLPAAYRANSVEEFLNDTSLLTSDLRDLCLKMEKPSLIDLRDACADLVRGDESDEESSHDEKEYSNIQDHSRQSETRIHCKTRPDEVPDVWISKREQNQAQQEMSRKQMLHGNLSASAEAVGQSSQGSYVDFGEIDDEAQFKVKKVKVKICGRSIWNYPSEKSMARGGWLQFSIIAKDSTLADAMGLCRSWDELFSLSVIAIYGYFPSAKWNSWHQKGNQQQFVNLVK